MWRPRCAIAGHLGRWEIRGLRGQRDLQETQETTDLKGDQDQPEQKDHHQHFRLRRCSRKRKPAASRAQLFNTATAVQQVCREPGAEPNRVLLRRYVECMLNLCLFCFCSGLRACACAESLHAGSSASACRVYAECMPVSVCRLVCHVPVLNLCRTYCECMPNVLLVEFD